jgi:hypothetical protein
MLYRFSSEGIKDLRDRTHHAESEAIFLSILVPPCQMSGGRALYWTALDALKAAWLIPP